MDGIYITHPALPNCRELMDEGVTRFQVRVDETLGVFVIRKHRELAQGGGHQDHGYTLPAKPKGSPTWSHALCLPGIMGGNKGLAFILGDQCYWTETHVPEGGEAKAIGWVPLQSVREHQILSSLQTNPEPHRKFWLEAIDAEFKFSEGKPLGKKTRNWPPGFHLGWLTITMGTGFWTNHEMAGRDEKKPVLRIPMEGPKMNYLLKAMRRGAIISMAHRYPEELPEAAEFLREATKVEPADAKWASLLPLCEELRELGGNPTVGEKA